MSLLTSPGCTQLPRSPSPQGPVLMPQMEATQPPHPTLHTRDRGFWEETSCHAHPKAQAGNDMASPCLWTHLTTLWAAWLKPVPSWGGRELLVLHQHVDNATVLSWERQGLQEGC